MALKSIYSKYFQKSKVFIYPLLGIKRGVNVIPIETYICWDQHYTKDDMKLICLYETKKSTEFKEFERKVLIKHTRLVEIVKSEDKTVFVFDFSDLEENWDHFTNGRYSKLEANIKNKILKFFDKNSGNHAYMYSYLMPEKYFGQYSEILNVDEEFLKSVGELCDKPLLEKETLILEIADLENLNDKPKLNLWQNKKR